MLSRGDLFENEKSRSGKLQGTFIGVNLWVLEFFQNDTNVRFHLA